MSHVTHHDDCGCLSARYEAEIARLKAENTELRQALKGVNHEGGCYCDAQYARPGACTRHSPECERARIVLGKHKE